MAAPDAQAQAPRCSPRWLWLATCAGTLIATVVLTHTSERHPGAATFSQLRRRLQGDFQVQAGGDVTALPKFDDYSWMWGDAGNNILGHGFAELDPFRWSDWQDSAKTIRDLEGYSGESARPLEVMGKHADKVHYIRPIMPDLTSRTKLHFSRADDAIRYLALHQKEYSWMWGDAGTNMLGHGLAEIDPFRWSDWMSRAEIVASMKAYRGGKDGARPVELRKDGANKVTFRNVDQAISYLETGASSPAAAPPAPVPATAAPAARPPPVAQARIAAPDPARPAEPAPTVAPPELLPPTSAASAPGSAGATEWSFHFKNSTLFALLGASAVVGLLAACGSLAWVSGRKKRRSAKQGVAAALRDRGVSSDEGSDDEESPALNNLPTGSEFGREELQHLLWEVEAEEGSPTKALPSSEASPPDPRRKQEALREVERILETRDTTLLFGDGPEAQQKAEFRRVVRLLHPDKGLVSGERATLALRRVVEVRTWLLASAQ